MKIFLETDRLYLRSWKDGDEDCLVKYANNRKVSINLRDRFPFPYTLNDAHEWIAFAGSKEPVINFAIEFDGQAVGGIGLIPGEDVFRRCAEIGYWLGEPFWGKGLMVEALKAVTLYAFEQLDFIRLHAGVFDWNPASARVLEKAGYILESRMKKSVFKDGQILDQLMYVSIRGTIPTCGPSFN